MSVCQQTEFCPLGIWYHCRQTCSYTIQKVHFLQHFFFFLYFFQMLPSIAFCFCFVFFRTLHPFQKILAIGLTVKFRQNKAPYHHFGVKNFPSCLYMHPRGTIKFAVCKHTCGTTKMKTKKKWLFLANHD